ncbi:hypothetical protein HK100_001563 [Physocladia obscura]|uniref:BZIP domain-containing protein n=1 Tax=Physocladia obscura TaxID=109957 RepID=A0AAD5SXR1_9FUNG|nr:hypothetical protein HK100_001563 [Physocladia obscura]
MTPPSNDHSDKNSIITENGLFGSFLLEDDLFDFGETTASFSSPPQTSVNTRYEFGGIDINQCLVSQIVENADSNIVGLLDSTSAQMFSSLFPDTEFQTSQAPSRSSAQLLPSDAAKLLASTEAQLDSNPSLAPIVARLRQSLAYAAAATSQGTISPSTSPTSQFMNTPFLGTVDFTSPMTTLDTSPLLASMADAFAVQWDATLLSGSPIIQENNLLEKPKAKVGRKRKERPNDPVELLREMDIKRQRNTESARRSRVKRMAELDELHSSLDESRENERKALERVNVLEHELEKAKKLLALAGERVFEAMEHNDRILILVSLYNFPICRASFTVKRNATIELLQRKIAQEIHANSILPTDIAIFTDAKKCAPALFQLSSLPLSSINTLPLPPSHITCNPHWRLLDCLLFEIPLSHALTPQEDSDRPSLSAVGSKNTAFSYINVLYDVAIYARIYSGGEMVVRTGNAAEAVDRTCALLMF